MRIDSMDAARLIDHSVEKPPVPVSISQKTIPVAEEKRPLEENKAAPLSEKRLSVQ